MNHFDQSWQVFPHQGFATRQAYTVYSQTGCNCHYTMNFFKRQKVASIHEFYVICRHAIGTSKITAIGDGYPQVDNFSSHTIDKFW